MTPLALAGFLSIMSSMAVEVSNTFCGSDDLAELDRIFGNAPRLISYTSALMEAGLPNAGVAAWVSSAAVDVSSSPARGVIHVLHEHGRCLRTGAKQVGERTWFAGPERAVLDMAEDMPSPSSPEVLMKVLWSGWLDDIDWGQVPAMSEKLGFSDGLRRLCSVASALESLGELWEGSEVLLEDSLKTEPSAPWIELAAHKQCPNTEGREDFAHKVRWKDTAEGILSIIEH